MKLLANKMSQTGTEQLQVTKVNGMMIKQNLLDFSIIKYYICSFDTTVLL